MIIRRVSHQVDALITWLLLAVRLTAGFYVVGFIHSLRHFCFETIILYLAQVVVVGRCWSSVIRSSWRRLKIHRPAHHGARRVDFWWWAGRGGNVSVTCAGALFWSSMLAGTKWREHVRRERPRRPPRTFLRRQWRRKLVLILEPSASHHHHRPLQTRALFV